MIPGCNDCYVATCADVVRMRGRRLDKGIPLRQIALVSQVADQRASVSPNGRYFHPPAKLTAAELFVREDPNVQFHTRNGACVGHATSSQSLAPKVQVRISRALGYSVPFLATFEPVHLDRITLAKLNARTSRLVSAGTGFSQNGRRDSKRDQSRKVRSKSATRRFQFCRETATYAITCWSVIWRYVADRVYGLSCSARQHRRVPNLHFTPGPGLST